MDNKLGENIKRIRKNQQMTLKVLADATGFSISFLSQLERGKSSATLESLKKISLALGVEPGYLFNDSFSKGALIRRGTLEAEQLEKHKIHYQSLYDSVDKPAFAPHLVVLNPNQNEGNLIKHPGQEFLYVLEGQLTVQINNEKYILNPGDSVMFDTNNKHYWYNYTHKQVKFLCVNYDKAFEL